MILTLNWSGSRWDSIGQSAEIDSEKQNQKRQNPRQLTYMNAFISYSTLDKVIAGTIKTSLKGLLIDSFLAHEDLAISTEWKDKIIEHLKACDVFIPVLSQNFKESEWCSQEVGYIVSRLKKVIIMPISLDLTQPYGFISHIQGKRVDANTDYSALLINVLLEKKFNMAFELVLQQVIHSSSWRNAEIVTKRIMPYFGKFSIIQANEFAKACIDNGEVWDAGDCAVTIIPKFLLIWGKKINNRLYEELSYQITQRQWYKSKTLPDLPS